MRSIYITIITLATLMVLTSPCEAYSPLPPYTKEESKLIMAETTKVGIKFGQKVNKLIAKRFYAVPPKTKNDIAIQVGWALDYYSPNMKAELILILERHVKDPARLREALNHTNDHWAQGLRVIYKAYMRAWCRLYGIDPYGYTTPPQPHSLRLLKKNNGQLDPLGYTPLIMVGAKEGGVMPGCAGKIPMIYGQWREGPMIVMDHGTHFAWYIYFEGCLRLIQEEVKPDDE